VLQLAKQEAVLSDVQKDTVQLVVRLAQVTAENRQMFNELMEMKGNIRVVARVRPLVSRGATHVVPCGVRCVVTAAPCVVMPECGRGEARRGRRRFSHVATEDCGRGASNGRRRHEAVHVGPSL
jgi:hypothetical protein